MHYRIFSIAITIVCLFSCALSGAAQETNTAEDVEKPVILYSTPKKYEIADIKVEGADNYEDYVIIGLSGLSKGQVITVPGDEITQACKKYWRHGLFSDVSITADKIENNKIWTEKNCRSSLYNKTHHLRFHLYRTYILKSSLYQQQKL